MSAVAANYAVNVCSLQDVAAKMVLTVLAWRAPKETPDEASMTVAMLQERSGLKSRNGVKDALRRLIDAGEVEVLRAGAPGAAAKYRLLRVSQQPEVSASDRSATDPYGSNADTYGSNGDTYGSPTDPYKTYRHNKTKDTRADAQAAPATTSPSLPSSSPARPPRKKAVKVEVDLADLKLPHGPEFRAWWVRFMDYRRQPIKGRRNPLTKLAADLILEDLAEISESDAMKAIRDAITGNWVKPYTERYARTAPVASKVVEFKARASDDSYEREIERRVGGIKA
ncbi:MAG: hypothetical protein EBR82_38585 [Caulobacteraceae bacterium]|nr:hypothetical protein [Caulobacteraceae bacterium]